MEAKTILPDSILGRFSIFDPKDPEFFIPPTDVIRSIDEIDDENFKTYKLKDAASFFAEAMQYKLAQIVVESWIDQGDNIFMIVGCRISSNSRIDLLEVYQVDYKWVESEDVIQSGLLNQYVSWIAFDQIQGDPEMAVGVKLGTSRSTQEWDTMERGRIEEKIHYSKAIGEKDIGILL